MQEPYGVGLDIGTNSVGWTVVDGSGKLRRVKGKVAIGARLFKEGEAAADRRSFRTTRRRLKRRKWRLRLLREIFDEPISKIDPNFFARRKYADISPRDPNYDGLVKTLFNDRTDKAFYEAYPTIYHLRNALMTEQRQFDIREIYMAIHHIVKYRGNFLRSGQARQYRTVPLKLGADFQQISELWAQIDPELGLTLVTDDEQIGLIKRILLRTDLSRSDRQKKIVPLLAVLSNDKNLKKQQKAVVTEFAKALVGTKVKTNVITLVEIDSAVKSDWSFTMDMFQESLPTIEGELDNPRTELLEKTAELYAAINLAQLIPEGLTFSQSMMEKYTRHAKHLEWLKNYVDMQVDNQRGRDIRATYDHYIDGLKGRPVSRADFYRALRKFTDADAATNELAAKINTQIELEKFMPKLRTKQNGTIPYQVQQNELDLIIANQAKYYPWLAEKNPVKKRQGAFPYKLDELVGFRVPYYVGPMVTTEDQEKGSEANFAWMVRKAKGDITPWNFDDKVDRVESATQFIQRMQMTDTYLVGEDVLPQQSLIYQRFMVLNELNKIRLDGQPIGVKQKQRVFEQVFKKKKTVSIKDVQRNVVAAGEFEIEPEVTGLADPHKFNSSFSTYIDLSKIMPTELDDESKQSDIEKIIMWSTIFEDAAIFKVKLESISWLTEKQRHQLSHIRYRGWGKLSKRLLTEFKDQNGRSILDALWATNKNFMGLQSQPDFAAQIQAANTQDVDGQSFQNSINEMYTSPQNKKALRQVMLVLADIQTAMQGQAPSHIFIEAARGGGKKGVRTLTRAEQVSELYKGAAREIISDEVKQEFETKNKNQVDFTDKLMLYFMQNGQDIYTGKPISIDDLPGNKYQIDHIVPQSYVKDDSLDNRVLTACNQLKGERFAADVFQNETGIWHQWQKRGLITNRKLQHLLMKAETFDKYATGFVNRQLVETRQVIKLVTSLLNLEYPNTSIVSVKADLTHQFRKVLNFPKLREVNNKHHAFDAYLVAFIGTFLLKKYPKMENFFVYGKFAKQPLDSNKFNVIRMLEKAQKPITADDTGEILWDRTTDLPRITKIYNFKRILITREVYENRAALFNQTIYKAKDAQKQTLIPKKQNFDTNIYGGYSSRKLAYLAIVKVPTKTSFEYRVVGVPTLMVTRIQQLKQKMSEVDALTKLLVPMFTKVNKRTGKAVVSDYQVILPQVRFEQVVRDSIKGYTHRFALGTDTYYHNLQELYLPLEVQRLFKNDDSDAVLDEVFDATMDQMTRYFTLYDINQFRTKLLDSDERFKALKPLNTIVDHKVVLGKQSVLRAIFVGLHANATMSDLKALGIKTPFGKLQVPGGLKLSRQAQIVYQSPTGLFERVVGIKTLE